MDKRIRRFYMPMTETSFYILFALQSEMHGYSIMKHVKTLTKGEIDLGAGTVYTSLSKMEKDGLIVLVKIESNRKFYKITDLGREILDIEILRIERLYKNTRA
ncbi:PadR family transcriptional regulator [Oceanobacillus profundus]|uniref:PadR family transcriptional regulator n=1 Tax=Oceanobacillus TaxID=182709 RepID=UPI0026E3166F|nr:PadR family transcriptional regulator [Oceanobacillus profundus]MDO6450527.1 PadR family transcriptional regulator [Oceanobacillus profundus]